MSVWDRSSRVAFHGIVCRSRSTALRTNCRLRLQQRRRRWLRALLLGTLGIGLHGSVMGQTPDLPSGASVVGGQVAIAAAGNTLDVSAATSRSIVDWNSFNVGAGHVANFNLPDANSAILNRVTSPDMASTIAGALNSNGHVYLVNPSGIVVSQSGMVNTNGFTASTFDVANDQFMAGGAQSFANNGSNASIVNHGTINTGAGGANLIANEIANHGTITSTGGNITLSGGGTVTLNNGVTYVQPTLGTLVSGISPTAGLIQNTGTIRATGAATSGGEVYLVNPNGKILHDGTIAAQSSLDSPSRDGLAGLDSESRATIGGHVQLEAKDITLTANSSIDATGTHGGGEVLVGGNWQGSGSMTQATTVTMEAGATIDASAIASGNGGKIVLWSDVTNANSITSVAGTLLAKAGDLFGNGGQLETSGHSIETNGISVSAGAINGDGGLWLIDPYNYVINAIAASNIVSALNTGTSVTVSTTASNVSQGSSGNSADLGDISVTSNIVTGAMSGDATLLLKADRHISLGNNVSIDATQNGNTAKLNVKLWADQDNSGDGINIVGGSIKTNGGSLQFGNGDTAIIQGVATKVGGDVYLNGIAAQSIVTSGGSVIVRGESILANANGITVNSGGGNIDFQGLINSGNQYLYVDGPDGQANSWDWARTNAKNGTAGGSALGDSYLVTINSRLENAVAGFASGYRGAWIGAYRPSGNNWVWADGPEAGKTFFVANSGVAGGTTQPGYFSNFGSGEPNGQISSGENRGQFFGSAGQWNDLPSDRTFAASQVDQYSVLGYVRETNLAPTSLTINAGSGSVSLGGAVGTSKALAALSVTGGSGININGGAINTTGIQTFNSPVLLGAHTNVSTIQNNIVFGSTVDSNSAANKWNLTATITPSNVYHWVDWTSWNNATKTATGTITVGSEVITVTYYNPQGIYEAQTSGGTNYWTGPGGGAFVGASPYVSSNVANGPSTSDIIKLQYGGSQTLTFSESVENLAFSIVSMNGNGYGFDQDFTIEANTGLNGAGSGYYGTGAFVKAMVGDTYQLNDAQTNSPSEPHGTIRFGNAFSNLTWDSLSNEQWNGFTVGVSGTSSTAGSVQFNGAVGGTNALGSMTVNAAVQTTAEIAAASSLNVTGLANLGGNITTTGNQTFGSAVTFSNDLELKTTANGSVSAISTIDGAHDLTIQANGSGNVTLNRAVGSVNALTGLTINTSTNTGDVTLASTAKVNGDVNIFGGNIVVGGTISKTTLADTTVNLQASGGVTVNSGVMIGTSGRITDVVIANGTASNFNGVFTGDGSLTKNGSGFLKINTAQTYTGNTIINDGILMLGANNVIPDLSRLIVNQNGILSLNSFNDTVGSIEGDGIIENGSIVRDGIVLWLDAGNSASYNGTGITWHDLSGNAYDATLYGNPTYNAAKRQFEFTTNAQYAQLGALPANFLSSGDGVLDGLTLFTVADFGTANNWERIIDFGNGPYNDNLVLSRYGNTNAVNFELYPGTTQTEHKVDVAGSNTLIPAGGGVRSYAATADGTNLRLFADGGLQVTKADSVLPNQVVLNNNYIGKSNWVADDTLRGSIGIVLVYDRTLTTSEIQQNHSALISRSPATLTVGGNNLSTTFAGRLENGADTLNLAKIGTGTLTLTGNNGFAGATTINGGAINIGSDGATGTLGLGNVINNASLFIDRNNDVTLPNNISGNGTLIKLGINTATLSGLQTYTGNTAVTGSLIYQNNVAPTIPSFTGTGSIAIQPTGTSFSSGVLSNYNFANTLSGLTLGKSGNTASVTVNSAISIDGDVNLRGGNVAISNTVATTAGKTITIEASGNAAQTAAITTDKLALQGTGNFTLNNLSNDVNTLAAGTTGSRLGSLSYVNVDALTIGSVGVQSGIHTSETQNIATLVGDLTLAQNLSTTNTTSSAISLNAGRSAVAGTASGGNIIVSGSPTVSVGAGGRATLFSGSLTDSTGIADLIGSGSGHFRYNSDEAAANYSLALGTGVFGIYREQPSITVAAIDQSVTYGSAHALDIGMTGVGNGDTVGQVLGNPSLAVAGSLSTGGKPVVGTHSLTITGDTNQLGYAIAARNPGTLTVNQKTLTYSGSASDKIYDGLTSVLLSHSASGIVAGDLIAIGGSGTFADKNVGIGKSVAISGVNLSGADATNYTIAGTAASTADITARSVAISGMSGTNRVYDGTTIGTLGGTSSLNTLSGDDVQLEGTAIVNFDTQDVGNNKLLSVQGFLLGGADAGNYSVTQPTGLTATITPAQLLVIANNDAKFVTKNDVAGFAGVSYNGFVSSENDSVLAGSLSIARMGANESAGTYAGALQASGLSASNYSLTYVNGDYTIVPADQLLVRFGNTHSTYGDAHGLNFLSAQYMDSVSTIHTLNPVSVVGNQYTFDDGVGGTADFNIGLSGASLSSSGNFNVGSYALGLSNLTETSNNFSNTVNVVGNHAIDRATINVAAGGVSKVYDGTTSMNNITLNQTGRISGDIVTLSGQSNYDSRNVGAGLGFSVGNVALGGVDSGNYVIAGGDFFSGNNGVITPKEVTIHAPTATKVYDGNTNFAVGAAQLQALTNALGVAGDSVSSITLTYDNKNVGSSKVLSGSNISVDDGNGGLNYNITLADNANSAITRLGTATWIGGPTGDWNDPANWAGGAIPDLANVANVVIPQGVTPTFGSNVAGPVELDSLLGGSLIVDGGSLDVQGTTTLDQFTQQGGTVESGNFTVNDFVQSAGTLLVNGYFDVLNSFAQTGSGTVDVTGNVSITQNSGDLEVRNLSGQNVNLNAPSGGVSLGGVNASGGLDVTAGSGDIGQISGTSVTVVGTTTLTASGDITLGNDGNDFQGPVNAAGNNVLLKDSTGGLTLGDIYTRGTFDATSTDGPITQSATGVIVNAGTTTIDASQAGNPADIVLGGSHNDFGSDVNLVGRNITIVDSTGDLTLGTVNASGTFSADARSGVLNQKPGGTVAVNGVANLNAKTQVSLPNGNNDFRGLVNSNAPRFLVNDIDGKIQSGFIVAEQGASAATALLSSAVFDTDTRYKTPTGGSSGSAVDGIREGYNRVVDWLSSWLGSDTSSDNALPVIELVNENTSADQSPQETYIRTKKKHEGERSKIL